MFQMSGGEHFRGYLPVEEAGRRIALVGRHPNVMIMNCCSGRPISVRQLVEEHIAWKGAEIELELGYYPYPEYEPMAFRGMGRR